MKIQCLCQDNKEEIQMGNINISIRNKHAFTDVLSEGPIVCANSDYTLTFDFDSEWDSEKVRTVRVIHGSTYTDIVMEGNECTLPEVRGVAFIAVGVYAGNIKTTTPAIIPCDASITCKSGTPAAPSEDVYNQIMALLNDVVHDAREATDNFNAHVEDVNNGEYQPDYDDNDENSKNHIKNRPFYEYVKEVPIVFTPTDSFGEAQVLNMKTNIDINKTYIGRAHFVNGATQDVPCVLTDLSSEAGLAPGTVVRCDLLGDIGIIIFGADVSDGVVGDFITVILNTTREIVTKGEFLQLDESTGEYISVTGTTKVLKKIDGKFIDFPVVEQGLKPDSENAISSKAVNEALDSAMKNINTALANVYGSIQTLDYEISREIDGMSTELKSYVDETLRGIENGSY